MKTVVPFEAGWSPSILDLTQLLIHFAVYQHSDVEEVSQLTFIDTQTFRIRLVAAASNRSRGAWLETSFDNFV